MTKALLTFFGTFCIFTFIDAQTTTYHSFPDSNAVWNFHYQAYCFWNGHADERYSIVLSGDTTINNNVYKKLTTPFVINNSNGNCGGIISGYKGAVRHDSINKKVYFIPPSDSSEYLLYDFTLNIGDTIRGYLGTHKPVVQNIDSVLVGNNYRKRWVLDSSYYFANIVEGIGSTYGLIIEFPPPVTDLPDYSLLCFQHNQDTYNNSNCQLITSLKNNKPIQKGFSIYPNPSSGNIQIESNEQLQSIDIYNIQGQKLKSLSLQVRSWQLPKEKGLYLIRLQDKEGGFYTEKVIRK